MEGKTVILSVLILSLGVVQIEVDAKSCCESTTARNCYNLCRLGGKNPRQVCAACGCIIISGTRCPSDYPKDILKTAVNEYCKLGCASSVCNAIGNLQNSGEEVVNEAVEQCYKACSAFCTKGFTSAVETA